MQCLLFLASILLPILFANSGLTLASSETGSTFDPLAFSQYWKVANCPGINRAENKTVNLALQYVDINPNAKRTLLLLHGWPSLWASWKYQIQEFRTQYRLIVPNIRGFGASTHPGDVQSSGSFPDLVGDALCILEGAGVSQAIAIGHDWGAQLAYEIARERPDIFTAVVGIAIPYTPAAGPFLPISALVPTFPHLAYQVYFSGQTPTAVAELNADIRRTLRATLRTVASPPPADFLLSNSSYLVGYQNISTIPPIPFFCPGEEDYWVSQYGIQGFNYTLEFYTTPDRLESYTFANSQGNQTIPQPAMSILPTEDPVANWVLAASLLNSSSFLLNFTQNTLPGAHWVHLEFPDKVNALIRQFLETL